VAGEPDARPRLRLLRGGRDNKITFRSLRIVAAPWNRPPFPVDAVVYEDDTYHVLSADPEFQEVTEHPIRLMTEVLAVRPSIPGEVIIKRGAPLAFLAVIHDLNQDPTWKEEWIIAALHGIFQQAEERKLETIALPVLGARYASLQRERFVVLLRQRLSQLSATSLKRLWLATPDGTSGELLRLLEMGRKEQWRRTQE
jgi:hypothetical protein